MDASFAYGETPSWHMRGGALVVLDPSTTPDGSDVHRLRALLEARAGLLGPFLRRLVAVLFGLDRPQRRLLPGKQLRNAAPNPPAPCRARRQGEPFRAS